MAEEVLKIKIVADTSDLKSSVNKAKQNLKELDKSGGTKETNENTEKLKVNLKGVSDQLKDIKKTEAFVGMVEALSNFTNVTDTFKDKIKMAGEELKGAFNFKAFKEGGAETFSDYFDSMKIQAGEAGKSIKGAFSGLTEGVTAIISSIPPQVTAIIAVVLAALAAMLASLVAIGVAIGVVVAGFALLSKNAMEVSKRVKAIHDEASKVGFSAQKYEEWGYVLKQVGVEADVLSDFVKTLTEEQIAAREGSEDIIKAFNAIGLSMEEVATLNQEDLFEKTVEGLQGLENESQRTAIAYKLLGEDAAQLNNILYLSNAETKSLINTYYALGGAPSALLTERSQMLEANLYNLNTAWEGLKNTLAEHVLPVIITVVNWLTQAIAIINAYIRVLFNMDDTQKKTDISNATTGMNNYKQSVQGATQAVKELKRITMGFDELNIVTDPNKAAGSAGAGGNPYGNMYGGAGGAHTNVPVIEYPKLEAMEGFLEKYKTIIQDVVTWTAIGGGALAVLAGVMTGNVGLILVGLAAVGVGVVIGSQEGSTFDRLKEKLKVVWENIKKYLEENVYPVFTKDYWNTKFDNIKASANEKLEEVKTTFSEKWENIKKWFAVNVAPKFTKEYWKNKFEAMREGIGEKLTETQKSIQFVWGLVEKWFKNNVAPKLTKDYWKTKFEDMKQGIADKLDEVKKGISDKWGNIKTWFKDTVAPKFTKDYWKTKFDNIKTGASEKLDEVKTTLSNKWGNIKKWFSDNVKPKFTKEYWTTKFNSIKQGATSAFNGVIDVVERAVNAIIRKINTLSWNIPSWVPVYGGKSFGFNFKQISIPRLATGGISNGSTLVNFGEDGKEAILPLEKNTGWMDSLADRIAARNSSPSKIYLMLNEKELGVATISSINNITRQTGNLPLVLA